jgi:aldehyde:ferredoxin oxidoreductase
MPVDKRSLGLIYAVNPFGADHQSSEHDTLYMPKSAPLFLERLARFGLTEPQSPKAMNPAKVRFAYETQLNYGVLDTLDLCQFVWGPSWQLYGPDELVTLARASTGWDDVTLEELQALGARRLNMLRAFNAREGAGRDRDTLPKRVFEPLQGGKTDGQALPREEFETALEQYYELAGWDAASGMPRPETLARLGRDSVLASWRAKHLLAQMFRPYRSRCQARISEPQVTMVDAICGPRPARVTESSAPAPA